MTTTKYSTLFEDQAFGIPGYISKQFHALDNKKFFIRNIFIPESFFVILEQTIVENKGDKRKKELYRMGKQFGYRFALLNRFPKGNINKVTMRSVFDFFQTIYAKKMTTLNIDSQLKMVELELDEFIVTSKDDMGYMPIGAGAGAWCYLNGDYNLDCSTQKLSKGKHVLLCANKKILKERGFEVIESKQMPESIDFKSYMGHNLPQKGMFKSSSFSQLLKTGIASYTPGIIKLEKSNERLIVLEISILFDIENTFDQKLISDSSYTPFYNIGLSLKEKEKPYDSLTELLSAFGFGIVQVTEKKDTVSVLFHGYPWFSTETEKTSFGLIKGAVLGFLNGITERKYELKSLSSEVTNNVFDVSMELEIKE